MNITVRKLEEAHEKIEAEHLIATSFLHEWDEEEAKKQAGNPFGHTWAAFDQAGRMTSAITTLDHEMTYEGGLISCGELHMAGSLPEARGSGAIRALIGEILHTYRDRGDLFALLM